MMPGDSRKPGSANRGIGAREQWLTMAAVAVLVCGAFRLSPAWATWSGTDTNAGNSFNANGAFPAFYHPTVIAGAPWLYHEMDDASGNTATDSSGNGHTGSYSASTGSGTLASATGATTGDGDTAALFGGATVNNGLPATGLCGYAVSDGVLAVSPTFTIEFWFRDADPNGGMLVDSGSYATMSGFTTATNVDRYVYLRSDGHLAFGFGAGAHDIVSPSAMDDGGWHMVDAVSNNGSATLYLDGASVGTASGDTASHDSNWRVGCDDTTNLALPPANNGVNGTIDEVAIFPTALSSTKVNAHWSARSSATYSSTITADSPTLYWRLDNATPDGQIADASGHGNIGHFFNFDSGGSVTLGATGALANAQSTSTAATYSHALGVNPASQNVTTAYAATEEAWFKTAPGYSTGGVIFALGDMPSSVPSVFERLVWMDNTGKLHFGVNSAGVLKVLNSTSAYNDGAWHMVDASLGAAGQKLYVDGALVASDASVTTGQADSTAYWRWGYCAYGLFTPQPTSMFFNGTLDELAIYNSQLADATIAATFQANY